MKAPGVFDLPDSLRAELAQERRTSARLAAFCAEQATEILRLQRLSAKLAIAFGRLRIGSPLSDALASGLLRGLARGFGGAS